MIQNNGTVVFQSGERISIPATLEIIWEVNFSLLTFNTYKVENQSLLKDRRRTATPFHPITSCQSANGR